LQNFEGLRGLNRHSSVANYLPRISLFYLVEGYSHGASPGVQND
jgi:hypothetical protein